MKFKIPSGYRALVKGETILATDQSDKTDGKYGPAPKEWVGKTLGETGYQDFGNSWIAIRKEETWYPMSEAKRVLGLLPGYTPVLVNQNGRVVGSTGQKVYDRMDTGTHFCLAPIPELPKPETHNGEVITWHENGDVSLGGHRATKRDIITLLRIRRELAELKVAGWPVDIKPNGTVHIGCQKFTKDEFEALV